MKMLLVLICCWICAGSCMAQLPGMDRWDSALTQFAEADQAQRPPTDEILFTGSSLIEQWYTLADDFAPLTTIRRGVAGATIAELVQHADRIIIPYKPRIVLVYAGEQDIANGKSPEAVRDDFLQLQQIIHTALPQTRIYYLAQYSSPYLVTKPSAVKKLNELIRALTRTYPLLGYIDVAPTLTIGHKLIPHSSVAPYDYSLLSSAIKPYLDLGSKSLTVRNLQAGIPQHIITYGTSLSAGMPWVSGMGDALSKDFPELVTITNSAAGGMWSGWGVDNLEVRVLQKKPDTVFIEFAINDAFLNYNTSVAQCRKNLETMIERIQAQNPRCEIFLMTMNIPLLSSQLMRPQFEDYYQVYRDVAKERQLPLIDHELLWKEILDSDAAKYQRFVPDGIHPGGEGNQQVTLPLILDTLYGRPHYLSPLQQQLAEYRVKVRFTQLAARGKTSVVTIPVTNTTAVPITFKAAWHLLDVTKGRISPSKRSIVIAPGKTASMRFSVKTADDLYQPPELHWTITAAAESVSGKAVLNLQGYGKYSTEDGTPKVPYLLRCNQPEQLNINLRNQWNGVKDSSGTAWLQRTKEGIRVHVDVLDDLLLGEGKNPWDNDSVEFYFDVRPLANRQAGNNAGVFQIVAVPWFAKTMPDTLFQYGAEAGKLTNIQLTSGVRDGGYWVEIFIPLEKLEAVHGPLGKEFAFDFAINDSDTAGVLKTQLRASGGLSSLAAPHSWILMSPQE